MSNLTGIIFGPREEDDNYVDMIKNYRTKNFSSLIKRRFVIGSYVLQKENKDRYFYNAQRVRRRVVDKFKEIFKEYDGVILPVETGPAKKFSDMNKQSKEENIILENYLDIANFGGFPSITIPCGFVSGLPVALNITGNCYKDEDVLGIAKYVEDMLNYKNQIAKEVTHE